MPLRSTLGGLAAIAMLATTSLAADGGVTELRIYHCNPGKLDGLNARMAGGETDLFVKQGMALVGFFTPTDAKDGKGETLVYMVRHADRAAADKSWQGFRDDPAWKAMKAETEKDGAYVAKVDRIFLEPTDYSPAVTPTAAATPRVFELRTYECSPGKLDDLNKRFRDHTCKLFEKHGMTNVAYWTQAEPKSETGTLTYLLAYPDREAAKASWKAFQADPEWQSAYKASQADGVPLAAKVTSMFLAPTGYSVMR